jgi:HSP20 family molecular chaperone IbpA
MTTSIPAIIQWFERSERESLDSTLTGTLKGIHVQETDQETIYFVDVPGIKKENLQVTLEGGEVLKVRANRVCEKQDPYCIQRQFKYDIPVEEDINPKKVTVGYFIFLYWDSNTPIILIILFRKGILCRTTIVLIST